MMARAKAERFTSPKGIAVWPRLNEPDTKFKATGEFSTKLAYEADDAAFLALVAKLEGIRDILSRGNGADRQLRVWNANRDIVEVVRELSKATEVGIAVTA